MQTINEIQTEISALFSPIMSEFRLKTYFSYYAIFHKDLMIALYQNERTYLRISQQDIEIISKYPETYHLSDDKIGLQSKKFHYLPHSILSDHSFFSHLVSATIQELEKEKKEIAQKRATQIRNLPNMNLTLERMLKKVGIHSIQDFTDVGYISAFIKLIMQGYDATADLLFKLNGALNHQYIYTFTEEQKRDLMQEANNALYTLGMRKRFVTDNPIE